MSEKKYNVLFICTGNSARSIMAEAVLNQLGKGRFLAYSAGSQPRGEVNPLALETLHSRKVNTASLRSKSWNEFASPDAPRMDIVVTVCDRAAAETCPLWPGQPISVHWAFPDPAAVNGSRDDKLKAFATSYRDISQRIRLFVDLPCAKLDRSALQYELRKLATRNDARTPLRC